jgi:phage major head subunit gpT-like protein
MLINKENVQDVFRNIRATYSQAFESAMAEVNWTAVATEERTNTISEIMDWIQDVPNWREWIGDKVVQALKAYGYTLNLTEFESTWAVKRRDLEADRLGIYSRKAKATGELAAYYPQERVFDLWNKGFTSVCYDGKPYFATDHPIQAKTGAKATFSNKLTVALSAATQEAALASLGAADVAMDKMVNSQGRPLRIRNRKLIVPSALKHVANVLYTNERLEDGKANPLRGQYEPVVVADLTSATGWYVVGESGGLKPAMHIVRKSPTSVEITDPKDSHVVMTGEFVYGQEADSGVGWTLPQLAVGSTGAG